MKSARSLLPLLALLLSTAASADGWYVHVAVGQTRSSGAPSKDSNDAEQAALGRTVVGARRSSRGETAFGAGVGYQFTRHLALEAGYVDLSVLHHYSASYTEAGNSGTSVKEWSAEDGVQLAAIGTLPVAGDFSLIGKAAATRIKGQYRTAFNTFSPPPANALVASGRSLEGATATIPVFGIGAAYSVARELQIRGTFERWKLKSGMFGAGNDIDRVDIFSLTVAYRL